MAHKELTDYITKAHAAGMSDNEIRIELLNGGWSAEAIQTAQEAVTVSQKISVDTRASSMKDFRGWLLLIFSIIIIVLSFGYATSYPRIPHPSIPNLSVALFDFERDYCQIILGGAWQQHDGFTVWEGCVFRYEDGGKPCIADNQCAGTCELAIGATSAFAGDGVRLQDVVRDGSGYIIGRCSSDNIPNKCSVAAISMAQPITDVPEEVTPACY